MMAIEWAERTWSCLPERALWWPEQQTLICADLHIGKDEAFRKAGVPVPDGALADDLDRLSQALARVSARRLIVLGDFFHARSGRGARVVDALSAWRTRHRALAITLVRGNHDRSAGEPPRALAIDTVRVLAIDGIALRHDPPKAVSGYSICGHLHPVFRPPLPGEPARPCYWFRSHLLVLPAFSSLAGGYRIRPARRDRIVLVGPDGSLWTGGSGKLVAPHPFQ